MSSFLTKKKDSTSFDEVLSTAPQSTQQNKRYAIKLLGRFVEDVYPERNTLDVIDELRLLKSQESQPYEDALYGMLQDWINWNQKKGRGNYTIRVAFSNIRKYLFHMGIKTSEQDIKEYLRFGKRAREDRHPLSQMEYQRIIDGLSRHPLVQALFLALGSSGMRIGEAISLKKKDLDLSGKRIKVNIPANTKTRTGRTTYLSLETEKLLRPHLERIQHDDEHIVIYLPKKNSGTYADSDYTSTEKEFLNLNNTWTAEQISQNESKVLCCMGFYSFTSLIDIKPEPGAVYIHSSSEPYNEGQVISGERADAWIEHFGMSRVQSHCSGHARGRDLLAAVADINAKSLYPVHTEHPEAYNAVSKNMVLIKEGIKYEL